MSDADKTSEQSRSDDEDATSQDENHVPNLVLLYSLIALALAAAIGFALMIVMPFHHRH